MIPREVADRLAPDKLKRLIEIKSAYPDTPLEKLPGNVMREVFTILHSAKPLSGRTSMSASDHHLIRGASERGRQAINFRHRNEYINRIPTTNAQPCLNNKLLRSTENAVKQGGKYVLPDRLGASLHRRFHALDPIRISKADIQAHANRWGDQIRRNACGKDTDQRVCLSARARARSNAMANSSLHGSLARLFSVA